MEQEDLAHSPIFSFNFQKLYKEMHRANNYSRKNVEMRKKDLTQFTEVVVVAVFLKIL